MGWAVGEREGRHIGYGVPATCDQPGCGKAIDRGLSYACGGGVMGNIENCGLFFCSEHLYDIGVGGQCDRCVRGEPPFDPTPDTDEWIEHILSDPSWAQWREANPDRVTAMARQLAASDG